MSKIAVNEITDEVGTGAPAFPNGMSVTGAALTDPEITGGIYLGGTGSANYLEDYEEGTWTPEYEPQNGSFSSINYTGSRSGKYVKIGSLVTVTGLVGTDGVSVGTASGRVLISGLPFSTSTQPLNYSTRTVGRNWGANNASAVVTIGEDSRLRIYYRDTAGGSDVFNNVSDLSTGGDSNYVQFSFSYNTDS